MKICGLICAALILSGCTNEKIEEVDDVPLKELPNEIVSTQEITSKQKKSLKTDVEQKKIALISEEIRKNTQLKSVSINGEKFTTQENKIIAGSEVFNLLMGEYGKVKGSIVIVSRNINKDEMKFRYSLSSVIGIAKNTFRIIPLENEALFTLYKTLSLEQEMETVELEIDYSGEVTQAKSY